ncbi:MAG TPA: phage portal protein, partial [Defluviitaleaceae bacterium]|nr:phage portal protein [Defluviitaleaceae bacterium]
MDYEKVLKLIYPEPGQSIFTDTQLKQIYELIKYYDYYENNVFKYIEAEYPEYRKTNERSPAQIPINYSQYVVDKLAEWQFEKPIDISVTTENKADDKKADEVEKDLYKLHKKNKMDLKLLQAAKECNISGGVAIKMIYDPELKMVRFLPRPRIECFPVTEFDDYEKINKVHFVAFKSEDIVWKQTFEMKDGKCLFSEATYNVKNNLELEEWIQKPTLLG